MTWILRLRWVIAAFMPRFLLNNVGMKTGDLSAPHLLVDAALIDTALIDAVLNGMMRYLRPVGAEFSGCLQCEFFLFDPLKAQ